MKSISEVQRLVAQVLEDSGFFTADTYANNQIEIVAEDGSSFLLVIEY